MIKIGQIYHSQKGIIEITKVQAMLADKKYLVQYVNIGNDDVYMFVSGGSFSNTLVLLSEEYELVEELQKIYPEYFI